MTYNQGDIVLIPFPFSDNSGTKLGPAIIISNSIVNRTQDIILAQITTNINNDNFSFPLSDKILTRSLDANCEIRCHKLFTAEKSIVKKKISSLKGNNFNGILKVIVSIINSSDSSV